MRDPAGDEPFSIFTVVVGTRTYTCDRTKHTHTHKMQVKLETSERSVDCTNVNILVVRVYYIVL